MGKSTISMAIFNSFLSVYQRVNLHFPMVFLWFSYGFPMVFLWFSYGFPIVPEKIMARLALIFSMASGGVMPRGSGSKNSTASLHPEKVGTGGMVDCL